VLFRSKDPDYIDATFRIIHASPRAHGINRTTWRQQDIHAVMKTQGYNLSESAISRIIRDAGYRYRKAKRVLTSNDPNYQQKLQRITDVLSHLGPKEKFFSVDEFGPFAIKIQGGVDLVKRGHRRTVPQFQKSKGSLIVTGALELSANKMTHFYSTSKDTNEMIRLLDMLLVEYAGQDCIYFSWDAASWHASKRLYERVEEINTAAADEENDTPTVSLVPLPSRAQFLNVIESVFSGMAKAVLHNSDYQSSEECKAAIDLHFEERNAFYRKYPRRAGKVIWGKETIPAVFNESNNCKDPRFR